MSLIDDISTPYTISFESNSSCERQSKDFERSISNAPKQDLGLGIVSTFLIN